MAVTVVKNLSREPLSTCLGAVDNWYLDTQI